MLESLNPAQKPDKETERPYPGVLVIVEGLDGSGKSTQLHLLHRWLELEGYPTYHTEWNSSPLVKSITSRSKSRRALTSFTFSLLHAADFADRCERQILPLLQAGYIVLADRYLYTAMVRDAARNCPVEWVAGNYSFAPTPDLALYFRTPLEVSLKRILRGRPSLKWHEAGMDLGLSHDPLESFRLYQGRLQTYYDELADAGYLTTLDATRSVHQLQKDTRTLFKQHINLDEFERSAT